MNAKDVIDEIGAALQQTKGEGHSTVSIDAMSNYLSLIEKDLDEDEHNQSLDHQTSLATFKAENDRNIAHTNNQTILSVEMFKSVITAGQSALKSSMIINGGGAVALLAFTGKIWSSTTLPEVSSNLTTSIFVFCLGVLMAAIATGTTYLSQLAFSSEWLKTGHTINWLTIAVVISSYVLFGYASFVAATSLGLHFGL